MSKILEMIEKRNQAWNAAKAFVESRRDKDGLLSEEDAKTYSEMEKKVKDYGAEIERLQAMEMMEQELSKPVNTPIVSRPQAGNPEEKPKTGRASDEYRKAMLTALRSNFKQVSNVLQEGVDADGGYLVPDEYDSRLIDVLDEENIMRKPYVEDYSYTKDIRISTLDCSSFTNPYQMKEYTEMRLAQYAKPSISYVLNAMDLSVLTGYEHEAWELGDYVRVEDKELGLSVTTRVVRREYNLQEPWNTVLELSTTLKNLGNSASEWDNAADALEGTSMVSNDDIREMVPFNLLRNSRADDGLAYWVNSGFEADGENGASGTASFECVGTAGMTKSMAQTVYPANRDSYTLSAQIASEDLEKLSDSSQVGIEVVIEYEDGSTESRFIDLF